MKLFTKTTKNKNGIKKTLWVDFNIDGIRYRRSLKIDDTRANRKLAKNSIIPAYLQEIYSKEFFKKQLLVPTVNDYIKRSFALNRGSRCSSTIYGHEKNYEKYIKNKFGFKKLCDISSEDITLWQNDLQEKERLAKATIQKIRSILYTMFEDAIDDKKIDISVNPLNRTKKLNQTEYPKVKRIELSPFNSSEISNIINSANNNCYKNILATCFYTGMRIGEIIGLKWENIDFKNQIILVNGQIVEGRYKNILKTSKSRRRIPIIKVLLSYLKNQFKVTGNLNSYVFLTPRSQKHFHSAGKIREQIWVRTLEKANVRYRNLHQTRGTFISTLISNGEDINYVSKIAGHNSVSITLDRYSEYIPKQNKNFGNCFGT